MGMFLPCLGAAILNGFALQIFREPMRVGNGPLLALYMFIFTMLILIWSIRLYPKNLRKIGRLQFIIEFLTAEFIMENLVIDFWFPLEKSVLDSLPALAENIDDWVSAQDLSADVITNFLKDESTGFYISYAMATFFLLAALHASRMIDIRTLTQEGPVCFFKEIGRKIKLSGKRILRKFGIVKRKVKINEQKNTLREIESSLEKPPSPATCSNGQRCRKRNRFCPVHNPFPKIDESEFSDIDNFGDLELSSNINCL